MRKPKILMVDDDFEVIRMLRENFKEDNYDLMDAPNGEKAIKLLQKDVPDLALLDVMMPIMNGWQVCKYIREQENLKHMGIIMLTGIGETLNELTAPLYGADEHLDKPFRFKDLEVKIKAVLKKRFPEEFKDL